MDAKDALGAGPVALITDAAAERQQSEQPQPHRRDHVPGPVPRSRHDVRRPVPRWPCRRRPRPRPTPAPRRWTWTRVYGGGPTASPQLYNPSDRAKLRIESGGRFEDVPRQSNGTAIIADPRNDENVVISGLQCRVHPVPQPSRRPGALAEPGRQRHDRVQPGPADRHLALPVDHRATSSCRRSSGRTGSTRSSAKAGGSTGPPSGQHFIPVEFQGAAYRFGHSMVRPSYRVNLAGNANNSAFFAMIFDPSGEGQADPVDMRGGRARPAALHRLADVLRLRPAVHRSGRDDARSQAEQAHRHEDLHTAVPPAAWRPSPAAIRRSRCP